MTHTDETARCIHCRELALGACYPFWVVKRGAFSHHIVHEERPFLCDRCAAARLRFAPLAVLLVWVPALALGALIASLPVLLDLKVLSAVGIWGSVGLVRLGVRLMLLLGLLFLLAGLLRLAFRQLRAVRERLFHHPPYSGSVARLAIALRKQDLLRALRLSESNAFFLTEEDRSVRMRHTPLSTS
jgi:hypothetical protein